MCWTSRLRHGLTAAAIALPLAALPGEGRAGGLTLAHPFPEGHEGERWARDIAACIDQRAGIPVELVPGRTLGSTAALAEAVVSGRIDLAVLPIWALARQRPELASLTIPGAVPSPSAILQSWAEKDILDLLDDVDVEKSGFSVLALGWQYQTLAVRANSGDMLDLAGRKIRTNSPEQSEFVAMLGAAPLQIPAAEVPFALTFGAIDGAIVSVESLPELTAKDSSLALIWSDDFVPFLVPLAVVMGRHTEYGWGDELQIIARQDCAELTQAFNQRSFEAAIAFIDGARSSGASIFDYPNADWRGASDRMLEELASRSQASDLVERLQLQ